MNVIQLSPRTRKYLGWALLLISFGIGLLTVYKGVFDDEADNLVVGSLLLRGYQLYRDVFSHHFPFPYYWAAIVLGIFGRSIFIERISVLVFQTAAFAFGMELSADYLIVGVTAIFWSIARSFYKGNMVLYNSFESAALFLLFITVLAVLKQRNPPGWKHWLAIGLFSAISILSDPLSIYAVLIALIFIFTKKPAWGIKAALVLFMCMSLYGGYLLITGTYQAFWENAILFNSQVYAKYIDTNPVRISRLFQIAVTGLGITDKVWFQLNPLKPITGVFTDLDRWVFTGFLYRFSIIASTLFLMSKKQYRLAGFLYLFAASILIIEKWDFHSQPFVLLALTTISALVTQEWWFETSNKSVRKIQILAGAFALVMVGWLCLRLMVNIYKNLPVYGDKQFARYQKVSARLLDLSCNQPGVSLGYYPGGTYYYWFTGMEPISKYVYMWPWVADIGLEDVIHELGQKQILAIVAREDGIVWDAYDTKVYLRPLDEFLNKNYHMAQEGIYQSPELFSRCSQP